MKRTVQMERLKRTGLILGLIGSVISIPIGFFACVGSFQSDLSPILVYAGFSWLWHFFILLVAIKNVLVGGLLLIIDGLIGFLLLGPGGLFFTPLLISGIVFIIYWYAERRVSRTL